MKTTYWPRAKGVVTSCSVATNLHADIVYEYMIYDSRDLTEKADLSVNGSGHLMPQRGGTIYESRAISYGDLGALRIFKKTLDAIPSRGESSYHLPPETRQLIYEYRKGKIITVSYDPRNPQRSLLIRGYSTFAPILITAGIFMIIFWFLYKLNLFPAGKR